MPIIQTQISAGKQPTGTKNITSNGIVDVAGYANADVQVPTTAPTYYREFSVDNNGELIPDSSSSFIMSFNGVKSFSSYILSSAFVGNLKIGQLNMSSVEKIVSTMCCYQAFYRCAGLTSIDLSGLKQIDGNYCCQNMFTNCTSLTNVDLSNLTHVQYINGGSYECKGMFSGCTSLTSVDLSKLIKIGSGSYAFTDMFSGCTSLTEIRFDSLNYVGSGSNFSYLFYNDINLANVYFPALMQVGSNGFTSQMLAGVIGCTLHFPKNLDPQTGSTIISSLTGYPNFGGTLTVLSFDQPTANILTGNNSQEYERNPKYDTITALAWRIKDVNFSNVSFTPYYTSTTSDPQVGDTIYSDASCTTAVTIIDSIA